MQHLSLRPTSREKYSQTRMVLPAMGYGDQQIKELEQTINSMPVDLVLIGTPILRVVGSVVVFVYERDWRFAAVTGVVLLVMLVSVVVGQG